MTDTQKQIAHVLLMAGTKEQKLTVLAACKLQAPSEMKLTVGGKYNWKNQKGRLVYIGMCEPRNGRWHQFAKVESPDAVWCEVLDSDLHMIEETKEPKMRLINADALLIELNTYQDDCMFNLKELNNLITNAPTIEGEPVGYVNTKFSGVFYKTLDEYKSTFGSTDNARSVYLSPHSHSQ